MTSKTETPDPRHMDLDLYPVEQLVDALVDDQAGAAKAVRASSAALVAAVRAAVPRLAAGGRLIYVGAGTSGRLGLQDAVELYPTFSWPPERAIALLAGGRGAVTEAVEGAEDELDRARPTCWRSSRCPASGVAVAASGRTPYVWARCAAHARRAP